MKRRLTSRYRYETHFNSGSLVLRPGLNVVDQGVVDEAMRLDSRFRQVTAAGMVANTGLQVDFLKDRVVKAPDELAIADVSTIDVEEARHIVRALGKNTAAIRRLAELSERGGVKAVFAQALEGRG